MNLKRPKGGIVAPRPTNLTVEAEIREDSLRFSLPPIGWRRITFFFFVWALGWNVISWTLFLKMFKNTPPSFPGQSMAKSMAGMILFLLIGILGILYFLGCLTMRTTFTIDGRQVKLVRRLFGYHRISSRETRDVSHVQSMAVVRTNHRSIYGIGMVFKNGKSFGFGAFLPEEEKAWIMGEIKQFVRREIRGRAFSSGVH